MERNAITYGSLPLYIKMCLLLPFKQHFMVEQHGEGTEEKT